jgi:RHS repeat-associated protein
VQQDANSNVTALVTTTGAVAERDVEDPYGKVTFLNASWGTLTGSAYAWVYLHQGGRFDITTGLYYFRMRDYSPTLMRWTSVDPKGFGAGDSNLYRDVGNDPTNATDPSGLDEGTKALPGPIDRKITGNQYGDWHITLQEVPKKDIKINDIKWQVDVHIEFTPTDKTKATEIGLIQSVRSFDNDRPRNYFYNGDDAENRATSPKSDFVGYYIDQHQGNTWPWYILNKDGKVDNKFGQFGSSPTKTAAAKDATLIDKAGASEFDLRLEYETAAIAKAADKGGDEPGKFYASLNWNINVSASGAVSFYGLNSHDTPTAWWLGAAKGWNEQVKSMKLGEEHQIKIK